MAGKIQRKNKTNKVNKKAKHARRTRRVIRKTLNKRKQRKGGTFMSRLNDLKNRESRGIMTTFGRCNMNETLYNIEDKGEEQITEGEFTNDDESESIKITKICRDASGNITFITDNKDKDKKRIDMEDFIKTYPKYQPPVDDKNEKISIKYYFDEKDGFKLKEKQIEAIKSRFNKFKRMFGL